MDSPMDQSPGRQIIPVQLLRRVPVPEPGERLGQTIAPGIPLPMLGVVVLIANFPFFTFFTSFPFFSSFTSFPFSSLAELPVDSTPSGKGRTGSPATFSTIFFLFCVTAYAIFSPPPEANANCAACAISSPPPEANANCAFLPISPPSSSLPCPLLCPNNTPCRFAGVACRKAEARVEYCCKRLALIHHATPRTPLATCLPPGAGPMVAKKLP